MSLLFEGPDIAATARLLLQAGVEGLPELPPDPYALSGRIQVDDPGARLSDVALAIGGIEVHADALMPSLSEIGEADLTLDASGPDASVIGTMAGFRLPELGGSDYARQGGARQDRHPDSTVFGSSSATTG